MRPCNMVEPRLFVFRLHKPEPCVFVCVWLDERQAGEYALYWDISYSTDLSCTLRYNMPEHAAVLEMFCACTGCVRCCC